MTNIYGKKQILGTAFYLVLSALLLSIIIYSCRKEPHLDTSDVEKIADDAVSSISHAELAEWYDENMPDSSVPSVSGKKGGKKKEPLQLKWKKAKQKIISGMTVVSVPVGKSSLLIFTKYNKKSPVTAFLYNFKNEKPGEKEFTGKVTWFNFQTLELRGVSMKGGRSAPMHLFEPKSHTHAQILEQIRREKRHKKQSNAPGVKEMPHDEEEYEEVVEAAYDALDEENYEEFWNWYFPWEESHGDGGWDAPSEGNLGRQGLYDLLNALEGASGVVTWSDYNPGQAMSKLLGDLNLGEDEENYFSSPYFNQTIFQHCYQYVYGQASILSESQKIAIIKKHIELMYDDYDYEDFVENYSPLNSGYNHVWWEDEVFLADNSNLLMLETGGTIPNWFKAMDISDISTATTDPDASYWTDSSPIFSPLTMPSWSSINSNYPKDPTGYKDMNFVDVYNLIGGVPKSIYLSNRAANSNACALRVSRALNQSGITIPSITDWTFLGADGKYYFMGAAKLYKWMSDSFGTTGSNVITTTLASLSGDHTAFNATISYNQGIFIMKPVSIATFGATGHATLYDNYNCIGGNCYFPYVNVLRLWKAY